MTTLASAPFREPVDYYARLDAPAHPKSRRLLDYWQSCMDTGGFLVGRDIPHRGIADLLSNVVLAEPIENATDCFMRLAGAMVRDRFGGDIKGRRLSEIRSGADFEHRIRATRDALRTGRPAIIDSRLRPGDLEEMHTEVILLPVTAPDRTSAWLLVGLFYFDR